MSFRVGPVACVVVLAALLGACAEAYENGDPGARPLAAGQSCQTIRAELDRLDARGVPSRIEAASAGKKLSPQQMDEVRRYNQLLDQYLGARCHVM